MYLQTIHLCIYICNIQFKYLKLVNITTKLTQRFIFASAGNDKPDLRDLYSNVIHQHAAHWENLGALLGLNNYDIANISRDHNRAVDACREMLMMWLKDIPSPTWGTLDDAIRSMMKASAPSSRGKYLASSTLSVIDGILSIVICIANIYQLM